MNNLDFFYQRSSPYSLSHAEKEQVLEQHLSQLDQHHYDRCFLYKRMVESFQSSPWGDQKLMLPVRLFKQFELKSIEDEDVFKVLTSSGTTSQVVSRIVLDRQTASHQSKVLVKIMQHYLGVQRLPMLIIDHPSVVKDRLSFSARGAGILGLSSFGRNHTYALDDDMNINLEQVQSFIEKHEGKPIFIFGFTFMVWQYFFQVLKQKNTRLNLENAVLIHSGGWKKLVDIAVDNSAFKQVAFETCRIKRVHNFYGMVEQVGSVFVECSHGYLHAPDYADINIIDLKTMSKLPFGQKGLIAVSSVLPSSYPGHRLLTEDIGTIYGEDDCACELKGKYFHVHGRVPKAEVRGCSDTHATEVKS
mgnify:CR=1 FL=1